MLGGGLPGAYRRVEYLESTGTQYIDTGIVLNKGCIIAVTFEVGDLSISDNYSSYGWRYYGDYGGKQQLYINARRDDNAIYRMVIAGVPASTSGTGGTIWYDLNVKNTIVLDSYSEKIYMNGVEVGGSYKYDFSNGTAFNSGGSSVYNPYLFAMNNKGAVAAISNRTKIYGYSIKQNNAFVQNFIPCVRKADNKPGMYDTVSKTFYINAGTGEFIVPN